MTYKNFPVYIGHANKKFTSQYGYHKDHMIYADRVNVSFNTASQPNRRLSQDISPDDQFLYTADLTCDIAFDFLLYPELREGRGDTIYAFLSDSNEFDQDESYVRGNNSGKNFFPMKIGRNFYNQCYLQSYTVDVSPFAPIKCSVNFRCYTPPETVSTEEDDSVPFNAYDEYMKSDDLVYGYNCEVSGVYDDVVYNDIIPRITYQKSYNNTPVYTLGNKKPTSYIMNSIESQMTVESTGLTKIFGFQGTKLENDIGVKLLNNSGERILPDYDGGFDIVMGSGARVNTQDYAVNGGDTISARATIQEVIL